MAQIVLGTANFGNVYGVSNNGRISSEEELKGIINWAQVNGINHFDTAVAYGNSIEILSKYIDLSLEPIIDSKIDEKNCQSRELIVETAKRIRQKLGVKELSVLYLHNEELLQSSLEFEISKGLKDVLSLGIARQIGVSVYSAESEIACKEKLPELSVFQVPENICDRRMLSSMAIRNLAGEGNSFVIRSIFLQGLLLMDPEKIPRHLLSAESSIKELISFASRHSLSVAEVCLAYAKSIPWASRIVVGVASLNQLVEIKNCSSILPLDWAPAISTLPLEIVDPREWLK